MAFYHVICYFRPNQSFLLLFFMTIMLVLPIGTNGYVLRYRMTGCFLMS